MRLATWNINSLPVRVERLEDWLAYAQPDILCLQETKIADTAFPEMAMVAAGYQVAHHGEGRWNGVAILSRVGLDDVERGFGLPVDEQGARMIAATCGGVRVHSVYVPNGRSVGSEHYAGKLEWLAALRSHLDKNCDPGDDVAVCGDFNVAPDDRDVWDPAAHVGATHVSEPERAALEEVKAWGLVDGFRQLHDEGGLFTWWDYRAGMFHKHMGMRIDLVLLSRSLAARARYTLVDRNARKGKQPSDHAPLFIDVASA